MVCVSASSTLGIQIIFPYLLVLNCVSLCLCLSVPVRPSAKETCTQTSSNQSARNDALHSARLTASCGSLLEKNTSEYTLFLRGVWPFHRV